MLAKPMRAALTALGTVLGVGTFVVVLGLTSTATGQISERFDAMKATEVVAGDMSAEVGAEGDPFGTEAVSRIMGVEGVEAAGVYVPGNEAAVTVNAAAEAEGVVGLVAASPEALDIVNPRLVTGRLFDHGHENRRERVTLLSSSVANRMGVNDLGAQPSVYIDGSPFTIIGIYDDVERRVDEMLLTAVIPLAADEDLHGDQTLPRSLLIETRNGAAPRVAEQLAVALDPARPDRYEVPAVYDATHLSEDVNTDLGVLFLALAGICLLIGLVGIANTTLVAVTERIGEYGLRRALGAKGRHIFIQVMVESGMLGCVGGVVGVSLGVFGVVGVAFAKQWTAIMDAWLMLAAPGVGLAVGVLAGLWPAWRASRIQPADALRR
ncbi:ABC transporter permease [Glycomyces sp. NPDC046736]|uniref:ABC transporter permease n=1 Tax=Glycomyces sp. NPDC046736 TaxID=3155615 RepID=UPI0033EE008E